jgi:hypothetical protein
MLMRLRLIQSLFFISTLVIMQRSYQRHVDAFAIDLISRRHYNAPTNGHVDAFAADLISNQRHIEAFAKDAII